MLGILRGRRLMTGLAAAAAAFLLADPASAAARYQPGAPGIGDPYFPQYGNGGYDVAHYHLAIRYDPATDRLDGTATIAARATQDLSSFNLDLVGLTVRSVAVNGRPAGFSRAGQELTVSPRPKLKRGIPFVAVVRYDGVPVTFEIPGFGIPAGFIHTDDGTVVAGQPEVAAAWYPVNDHPQDKAAYTFAITVPEGLSALANGRLVGQSTRGGWTTWVWAQAEPMISYLATATIGRFRVRTSTTAGGIPLIDAVDVDLPPGLADDALARQGEIMDFLAGFFGPYPFAAGGGIVDDYDDLFFALENQTRSVYSKYFFNDEGDQSELYVVVHEIAHQWYGDDVAVQLWRDIWLNEGFATYAEWLWSGRVGDGTPQEIFDFLCTLPPDDGIFNPPPGDPGPVDLFAESVYVRGAMTVHAVRQAVGDTAFFRILRDWPRTQGRGNGSTAEFIALAEQISGQQLDAVFDMWLHQPGKPAGCGAAASAASRAAPPAAVRSLQERLARTHRF